MKQINPAPACLLKILGVCERVVEVEAVCEGMTEEEAIYQVVKDPFYEVIWITRDLFLKRFG